MEYFTHIVHTLQVHAEDFDISSQFHHITYSLIDGDIDHFRINASTGSVVLVSPLDSERLLAMVKASDGGGRWATMC